MSMQSETEVPTAAPAGAVEMSYREAVGAALEDEMRSDPRVLLLGEDVAIDGGVFKTNTGLPEKFPGRVTNTPICENTFIGVGDRDGRHRDAPGRRDHVQRLPADRR